MKYSVVTFGCRVNQADSLGFEAELRAAGAVESAPNAADVVIVNTCSVTATADQGARQTIRRIARDNPQARIVVTGCYATRRADEVAQLPRVARVVPNEEKPVLVRLIRGVTERPAFEEAETCSVDAGDGPCGRAIEPGVAGRTAFTLRVQTGCAEPCSYCIIPTTRGAPRSVAMADVLSDVERIAASGFKEIVLTGVHLGSYGRDLESRSTLLELLEALDRQATASGREILFRISSLEPMDCSPEIVDLVAASDRFAPHFHLPLQHASNRVLTAMRRPYTIEQYAALADRIRDRIPHASIGSDVIVGFPGETDGDADRLVSYLQRSPLTHVHVFPYSDRPGTDASKMAAKVGGTAVRERGRRVREVAQQLTSAFRAAQVGTAHRALTIEDGTLAVTGNYLKLRIPPGRSRNEWVRIRVLSEHHGELLGG
ncbi:MAG TPA: tRNA (N(6)-L-threonylcarbamoyladenosine(37)-C(2))-methylthiotransferase MtaB [Rhodanobacteraceae bacterium]